MFSARSLLLDAFRCERREQRLELDDACRRLARRQVSASVHLNTYLQLLKRDSVMVLVGAPPQPFPVAASSLFMGRRRLTGSLIGGIRETKEALDFCGTHGIAADVEVIPKQGVNGAYERMLRSDVRYRFVIDLASIK